MKMDLIKIIKMKLAVAYINHSMKQSFLHLLLSSIFFLINHRVLFQDSTF